MRSLGGSEKRVVVKEVVGSCKDEVIILIETKMVCLDHMLLREVSPFHSLMLCVCLLLVLQRVSGCSRMKA